MVTKKLTKTKILKRIKIHKTHEEVLRKIRVMTAFKDEAAKRMLRGTKRLDPIKAEEWIKRELDDLMNGEKKTHNIINSMLMWSDTDQGSDFWSEKYFMAAEIEWDNISRKA